MLDCTDALSPKLVGREGGTGVPASAGLQIIVCTRWLSSLGFPEPGSARAVESQGRCFLGSISDLAPCPAPWYRVRLRPSYWHPRFLAEAKWKSA